MFENIINFFKKTKNKDEKQANSKSAAKERLHLVLMQDRANVSADFLELMKQEIIDVIKKYIEVDEGAIDVRLTNQANEDGTNGAPALYANIPIMNIKNEARKVEKPKEDKIEEKKEATTKKDNKKSSKPKDSKENNKKEVKEEKVENKEALEENDNKDQKEELKEEVKKEELKETAQEDSKEVDVQEQENKEEEVEIKN